MLETEAETVTLVRNLCNAGAQAIAVHARRTGEREANRATDRWREIRGVVAALAESHPEVVVSVNGDVFDAPLDVERARRESGASGVMIARAAMENASVFAAAKAGDTAALVPRAQFFRQYLVRSIESGNNWKNSKYVVQQALRQRSALSRPEVGVCRVVSCCVSLWFGVRVGWVASVDSFSSPTDHITLGASPAPWRNRHRPQDRDDR